MKAKLILVILLISYISPTLTPMDKKDLADKLLTKIKKLTTATTIDQDYMHNFRSNATIEINEINDLNVIRSKMGILGFNAYAIREVEKIYNKKYGSYENSFYKDNFNSLEIQRVKENKTIIQKREYCYKNYRKFDTGVELGPPFYRCLVEGAYKYIFEPQKAKVEFYSIIARYKNRALQVVIANGYTTASLNKVYSMEKLGGNCNFQYQGVNEQKDFENMKKILTSRTLIKITSKYFDEIAKINNEVYQEKESSEGVPDQKKINYIENLRKSINKGKLIGNSFGLLVKNIKSEVDEIHMSTFTKDKLSTITQKYGFPKKLEEELEYLILQKDGNSFSYSDYDIPEGKLPPYFKLTEYTGIVVKDDKTVFFAFIKANVKGYAPHRVYTNSQLKCRNYQCVFTCTETQIEYSENEIERVKEILSSFSIDSLYQKIDSMMKSQTLLYQNVPMRVGNYRAKINEDGTIKIYNIKTGQIIQSLGLSGDKLNGPYTLQIEDNGKLSIVNKYYEKSSLLFSGGKGTGPYTLSINDNGKFILLDINKVQVYTS